jgi:D-glycero-beta-D-manno-heptose 1-phosphate adenylyltransferase
MRIHHKLVFTNGCFDLLHSGHVDLLERARALGSRLVVGLNSDRSVRQLKGSTRPMVNQTERRRMLLALRCVDEVVLFDDATPVRLIETLSPDVLVKGGDWPVSKIVGADLVLARGGQVVSLPLLPGYSTTQVVERIVAQATAPVSPVAQGPWRKAS